MSNRAGLRLVGDTSQTPKATKPGGRPTNEDMGRSREHLTLGELRALLNAAKKTGRKSLRKRNHLLLLMMYRHGLRVSEAVSMKWQDVHLEVGEVFIRRVKGSTDGTHHLEHDENRGLAALRSSASSGFVFTGPSGRPIGENAVRELVAKLGKEAGLPFRVHPHQLRHTCGFDLIDQGVDLRRVQAWMGHKNIANTVRYTALSGNALRGVRARV